jgi:SSS family solute:Na+ symporter
MSTVDSALNSSATVLLLDFHKRYLNPNIGDRASVLFLRLATAVWGLLGTGAALLMIRARSALDVWWQISGIFGGALLGLFLLAFMKVRLRLWQGIVSIGVSILVISWGTFARDLPDSWQWAQCNLDSIIVGAVGTGAMMAAAGFFALMNRNRTVPA